MDMRKGIGYVILFVFLLFGCGKEGEISFKPSSVHSDFPVPEYAKLVEGEAANPQIDQYAKYEWEKAEEIESIHSDYFIKIIESGWEEKKDEQLGALRVFAKDDTIIWLITHNGYFSLSTLKNEG